MLFELLVLMGAVTFVIVPVQTAVRLDAGLGGIVLAVSIGLALAVAHEVGVHKLANSVDLIFAKRPEATQDRYLYLMYVAIGLVPVLTLIFGGVLAGHWS